VACFNTYALTYPKRNAVYSSQSAFLSCGGKLKKWTRNFHIFTVGKFSLVINNTGP